MGYRCPVCGDPQADDVHLANHLAFTALVRGGDHEAWLDERVPDWGGMDDETLADVVTEHAAETEYPQVFEDTTGETPAGDPPDGAETESRGHPGSVGPADGHQHVPDESAEYDQFRTIADPLSEDDAEREAREILEEARELTRRRRADGDDGTDLLSDDATEAETDEDAGAGSNDATDS